MTSRQLLEQIVDYYTLGVVDFSNKHPVTDFAMHPLRDDVHARIMSLIEKEQATESLHAAPEASRAAK